ncbi:hypothetical protein [Methylocystis parvus]|uniref:hypothetical protein n=1 Tax=Methylocystis parvus TaxID=134 RepID=UPI003C732BDD
MKFPLLVLLVALAGPAAAAQTVLSGNGSAEAAAIARGWVRKTPGVWTRVDERDAESPYHDAYERRGCRVEEDWDGKKYTAMVSCAPGVRPN